MRHEYFIFGTFLVSFSSFSPLLSEEPGPRMIVSLPSPFSFPDVIMNVSSLAVETNTSEYPALSSTYSSFRFRFAPAIFSGYVKLCLKFSLFLSFTNLLLGLIFLLCRKQPFNGIQFHILFLLNHFNLIITRQSVSNANVTLIFACGGYQRRNEMMKIACHDSRHLTFEDIHIHHSSEFRTTKLNEGNGLNEENKFNDA